MTARLSDCPGPNEENPHVVLFRYHGEVFKSLQKNKIFGLDDVNKFHIWRNCPTIEKRDQIIADQKDHPTYEFTDGEPYAIN